jgi:hypothetical protein
MIMTLQEFIDELQDILATEGDSIEVVTLYEAEAQTPAIGVWSIDGVRRVTVE